MLQKIIQKSHVTQLTKNKEYNYILIILQKLEK